MLSHSPQGPNCFWGLQNHSPSVAPTFLCSTARVANPMLGLQNQKGAVKTQPGGS